MDNLRLIKITDNQIFLTPEMRISLASTSLKGIDIKFKTVQDIYLEIEIVGYNNTNRSIEVLVVDYKPKNIEKFKTQIAKSKVSYIKFKPLLWEQIEPHLTSYVKDRLIREGIVIYNNNLNSSESTKSTIQNLSIFRRNLSEPSSSTTTISNHYNQHIPREPLIETVTETAKIYFNDADFNLGFVAFAYNSKELGQQFNLKIENHFILEEFNAVKSYFPKAFGGKKQFSINIIFTLRDKIVTDIVTTSLEIDGINETIIDSIKRERIAKLTTTPILKQIDKSLFTSDEIFDNFDDNLKDGNIFNQSEEDILNFLIEIKQVRNAKHLQYLSGSKHSTKQKLRFTLKPLFGFLFFIEGDTKNHFCWELLESHATYLWSFDKIESDIKFQYKRIEETINIIKDMGREAYKNAFRSHTIDHDLDFCTIEHSNINSGLKESFVEWQYRLKERLV